MFKPVLSLILFAWLFFSCGKEQEDPVVRLFTWEDFQNSLTKDMDYQAIVAKFGAPDRDAGSGIHIYVYELKDSTEIWIGYISKILYARHLDKNHNLLHTII